MAIGKEGRLYGIAVGDWVLGTIAKMKGTERNDWAQFWRATYQELGGGSNAVGDKGCPRAGAYGLWYLGRIRKAGRPRLNWPLPRVVKELGRKCRVRGSRGEAV